MSHKVGGALRREYVLIILCKVVHLYPHNTYYIVSEMRTKKLHTTNHEYLGDTMSLASIGPHMPNRNTASGWSSTSCSCIASSC